MFHFVIRSNSIDRKVEFHQLCVSRYVEKNKMLISSSDAQFLLTARIARVLVYIRQLHVHLKITSVGKEILIWWVYHCFLP